MSVNINTTNNIVSVQTDNNSVIVTNNNTGTTVNVSRPIASVVTVSSPGPQGAVGPQGIQGETGPPTPFTNIGSGVYSTTSSIQISGSFLVSGSSTFTNIGPAIFSGSVTISDSLTVNGFNVITSNQTSSLTSLSASYANTSSYAYYAETGLTSSYATTAGTANAVTQLNQNVVITGNLNVFGTASYNYVTASQLDVGTSYISVNIAEPGERFGGLKVYDSGSLSHQATASLSWDSQNNHWIYQNASGSTYSGGMLISGPRNTGAIGNEQGTTNNALMKGQGGDHITSSGIFEDASGNVTIGASGTGFYWDNTNSRLGIGTGSPATTLQIAGTTTTQNILVQTGATYDIGVNATRFRDGWFSRNVQCGSVWTANIAIAGTNLTFYNNLVAVLGTLFSTGNLLLSTGTQTDAGYRLAINSSGSLSGSLYITGSSNQTLLRIDSPASSSILFVSGSGNVGIGTSTPSFRLDVVGNDARINTLTVGLGGGQQSTNTAIGVNALSVNTTGVGNVAIGINSLLANTTGNSNISIGQATLSTNIGGVQNTAVGSSTLQNISAGSGNTSFGFYNLNGLTSGNQNITMGAFSGRFLSDGTTVLTTMNNSVLLGYQTYPLGNAQTNQIVIGHNATGLGSNSAVLGNDSITRTALKGNISIGTTGSISSRLHVQGSGTTSATTALRVENTNASASLVVLDNGYVGIGTSSAQYQLDVYGTYHQYQAQGGIARYDISSANANQNRGVWDFYTNAAVAPDFFGRFGFKFEGGTADSFKQFQVHVADSTTPKFVVDGSGRTGIGTIAPSAKLHVSGSTSEALLIASSSAGPALYVSGSGNVGIGTSTPAYTLDVNGTARFVSDIRSTTGVYIGTTATFAGVFPTGTAGRETMNIRGGLFPTDVGSDVIISNAQGDVANTTSNRTLLSLSRGFNPTSGGGIYNVIQINPTINQTGGASGASRGLYINPTLTSAFDFRAIDSTNGRVVIADTATVTGSNATSLLDLSQTWNTSGQPIAIKLNITDTTSAALSDLMSLQVGGSPRFRILKSGYFVHNTGGEINGTLIVGSNATATARLQVRGSGATNATTTFLLQNSSPTNLLSVLDNGQVSFTSPTMSLAASQSAFSIAPIISASNVVGGQYYGVNIAPTFFQTTGSQTETAFRVAATYNQTSAVATGGTNIIADFGSTSAGSQLTVTDVTSGSIYMVNDVSGIPIIEATSNWDVNIYDFPNKIFEKTGSQVNIYGTLRVSGSFILPLSQSATPQLGSAYWSGSLLFIYNGTRYMSASFA